MTALKTALRIIALIIIVCIVGYVFFFVTGHGQPTGNSTATSTMATSTTTGQTVQVPVVIHTIKEQASTTAQVSVEYPQFPTLDAAFNSAIEKAVTSRLADFRSESAENYKARTTTAPIDQHISASDFNFIAKWQPAQINARYVSFIIRFDSYTGGANENQTIQTFNYDVAHKKMLGLADIFPGAKPVLAQVSTISAKALADQMTKSSNSDTPVVPYKEGIAPTAENYKNFTFTEYLLTIYFPKYSVGAGAFGEMHVDIPLKDIK